MKEPAADLNFLRTLVPIEDSSPVQQVPEKSRIAWWGPTKKKDSSQATHPLPPDLGLDTGVSSQATCDDASSEHLQTLQKLDQVLRKSQETTSEVKALRDQVATLLEVVHGLAADPSCTAAKEGFTAQTWVKSHAGSSKWASNARFDIGKELLGLKQTVGTLEIALRQHPAFEHTLEKDRHGAEVKSAITALESRLEFRMSALQEVDANILQRCDECTKSNEFIKSILLGLQGGSEVRRRISSQKEMETNLLVTNVNELDLDAPRNGNSVLKEQDHPTTIEHSAKSRISDLTGSAAIKGWSEPPEEDVNGLALRVVDSASFAVVFVDLAMVGVISHSDMHNAIDQKSSEGWVSAVQLVMALIFTAELTIRWCIQRWQFFVGANCAWNLFDSFVTCVSLLNALLQIGNGGKALAHVSFLRVLRLLRLVRAAKMLRKLRMLYHFRLMVDCMAHALMPTLWGFLLVLFTIYIVAAVLVQLLEVDIREDTSPDPDIIRLYGGLDRSMYTLYLAISGGGPWNEFVEPLGRRSDWYRVVFILYVSFVTFGVLNIMSAVFVSLVSRFVCKEHEEHLKDDYLADTAVMEDLRSLLNQENTREDGRISLRRVEKILNGKGGDFLAKLRLNMEQVTGAFQMLDAEEKGIANIDEFLCSLVQLKTNPNSIHVSTLMYENKRLMLRIRRVAEVVQEGFADLRLQIS